MIKEGKMNEKLQVFLCLNCQESAGNLLINAKNRNLRKVIYCKKKRERSKLYKLRSAHTVGMRAYRILDSRGGLGTSVTLGK